MEESFLGTGRILAINGNIVNAKKRTILLFVCHMSVLPYNCTILLKLSTFVHYRLPMIGNDVVICDCSGNAMI